MIPSQPDLIEAPENDSEREAWRRELAAWREAARREMNYSGAAYRQPEFAWVSSCYCCNKLMLWDETFMDHRTGKTDVEGYLREGERVFGGYDAVVLWHAYPRIGFDDRNQFDYYREFPGGLDGLRDVVRRFHRRGVRIFVDYNPWDVGTRREPVADAVALGGVIRAIEADGIFLDTLNQGGIELRREADRARPGVAFESELALPLEGLELNHSSWAQWFDSPEAPGVLRNRWFEQRHMMHLVRRWDTDHSTEMHLAWMNGAGMLVWENVFGSWNGWSPANQALLRRMLPVQRHFHRHFTEGQWTPLVPTGTPGVYASEWELGGIQLWTIVNRRPQAATGTWIAPPLAPGVRLFDLLAGEEIHRAEGAIPGHDIAAVAAVQMERMTDDLRTFLTAQRHRHAPKPINRNLNSEPLSPPGERGRGEGKGSPLEATNLLAIPAGTYELTTHFRARESGERGYARYENMAYPPLHADVSETQTVYTGAFLLQPREVSNGEYFEFLLATGYHPAATDNFLHHWKDGKPLPGEEDAPVVYVNLDDARAYADWRGMRLPTEAEWQIGMERHQPDRGPKPVWNWTESVASDGRTRFSILKGGSWYEAKGSWWYADGGVRNPQFAAKFIHLWAGLDRSPTIGFRCAASVT